MANQNKPHTARIIIALAGLAVLGYIVYLVAVMIWHAHDIKQIAVESSISDVSVIKPLQALEKADLTLPGSIDAWYRAPLYPQVSGYVKMWYKDYGAEVKAGDLLAEINAPALDAQFAQAKASLNAEVAKYNLAVITASRWKNMLKANAVSGQSVSVAIANESAERANMEAAQRNVDHFEALENFKRIVAPYDGIVTSRGINVGDYVSNGSGDHETGSEATELFIVADIHKLRLFVSVPEAFSYILQPGLTATFNVPQYVGQTFKANYLTSSGGYNPVTRTAVAEFELANPGHKLWPGSFASVRLSANNEGAKLFRIPTACLVFQEKGMQVAVVDAQNHAHFHNITIGRMGDSTTEVANGINAGDRIINNPPADLLEGDLVNITKPTPGYNESGWLEKDEDAE